MRAYTTGGEVGFAAEEEVGGQNPEDAIGEETQTTVEEAEVPGTPLFISFNVPC